MGQAVAMDAVLGLGVDGPGRRVKAASLDEAAQEFEAVFVAQMLRVMRESVHSEGLFGEAPGQDIQMSMMDQEMARELVRRGGFGLAQQIRGYLIETAAKTEGAE